MDGDPTTDRELPRSPSPLAHPDDSAGGFMTGDERKGFEEVRQISDVALVVGSTDTVGLDRYESVVVRELRNRQLPQFHRSWRGHYCGNSGLNIVHSANVTVNRLPQYRAGTIKRERRREGRAFGWRVQSRDSRIPTRD